MPTKEEIQARYLRGEINKTTYDELLNRLRAHQYDQEEAIKLDHQAYLRDMGKLERQNKMSDLYKRGSEGDVQAKSEYEKLKFGDYRPASKPVKAASALRLKGA